MRLLYRRNRAQRLKRQKLYYSSHRQERLEYWKRYCLANPELIREARHAYRLKNIDRIRRVDLLRSRKRNARPEFKAAQAAYYQLIKPLRRRQWSERVSAAKKLLGNRCAVCSYDAHPEILEFDHVQPLHPKSSGHSRHWTDRAPAALIAPHRFQLLCPNCHAIKTVLERIESNEGSPSTHKRRHARARLIEQFGAECKRCGYDSNPLALEFDHRKPIFGRNRSSAVHHVGRHPDLFQLLCANCHTLKTIKDLALKKKHQTVAS